MSAAFRLPLDVFYEREARHPRQRFLVQPIGGGQVETLTWADVGHQARCRRTLASVPGIAPRQPHRTDLEKLRPTGSSITDCP